MTLIGVIADQLAQVFGIPTYASCPDLAKARILVDLNAAIQQIQDAGEDFYGRTDLPIDLVADQEIYVLPKEVQTVLDPVRLADGTLLTKIMSRGSLRRFANIFQDQLSVTVASGKPTHYFVEAKRDTSDVTGDDIKVEFHVVPPPDTLNAGTAKMVLQVIDEPGQFTADDLAAGTAILPVPHKYVESIFLPIARYSAMGSFLFYDKEKVPHLEDDYIRALQLLGKADPRRPQPADSQDAAMQIRQTKPGPTQIVQNPSQTGQTP